jgi:hypothetical protein
MIGIELERTLSYKDVEVGNAKMTALRVVVVNGKVKSISEGVASVEKETFVFGAHTNLNGQGENREEVLMYDYKTPASINAHELVKQFIAIVESDIA